LCFAGEEEALEEADAMPGIIGLASTEPEAGIASLFAEMASRMERYPWYCENRHIDEPAGLAMGRVSLGSVNGAEQPAVNEERSLLAVMDGELYDYDDQRRALEACGHVFHGHSQAELLLHGYESKGKEFFAGLHGQFVAAIWDRNLRRVILTNDRFGMRPLYYAKLRGRLLWASAIKALLADPAVCRQAHLRGIAQFFTFGHLLGEDTMLKGVRLLPAAGWLIYSLSDDRLSLDRYYRLTDSRHSNEGSEAAILQRIEEAFAKAVDRCTAGTERLGLSLSGGLDSRTILAAVPADRPITTVSMGVSGSMDHRGAEKMAKLRHCLHHSCVLGDGFLARFADYLKQMVQLTDGHYLSQCVILPTLPVYRELGIQVLLRGHAGELMHMAKAYNFSVDKKALAIRDDAGLEQWLYGRLQTYMLDGIEDSLFAPAHRREVANLARESLRACLRESERIQSPLQRIAHLFISQRLRRETALSMVKFGSLVETRLPYMDNELVDALLSAPPEMKLAEKIQEYILRRRMPAFLKVANSNTGTRVGAGPMARAFGNARLRVLAKLRVRGYQPYERLGLWLRRELRPLVEDLLLDERCLDRGLFDPNTIKSIVENHLSGRRNHTYLLMALMTFELGQRAFIDASNEIAADSTSHLDGAGSWRANPMRDSRPRSSLLPEDQALRG
jgi:asparagine synthase (glutamine-hydrolysing)